MAVGTTFDQWRKDVFFSAAEAVQESADILESMYRMWIRDRSDGFNPEVSDELRKELHIALGTAKWQLEEFERAVNLSHENCSSDKNIITRRRQFISAIENQISRIEKALNSSLIEEGRQPLCWVQLNEEERDDLAVFLSAAPEILQEPKKKNVDCSKGSSELRTMSDSARSFKDAITVDKDSRYVAEVAAKEPSKSKEEGCIQEEQLNGQRRTLSSPDIGAWTIMMADEEEDADRKLADVRPETPNRASSLCGVLRSVESTTKLRWFRNSFWKAKSEEHLQLRQGLSNYLNFRSITRFARGISGLTERSRSCLTSCKDSKASSVHQLAGRLNGLQRHMQGSQYHLQFGRSLRITFLLVLSVVLIVPFVLYST